MATLQEIQKNLKVPKSNLNSFGKYKYRSCEDILEAVKPLLGDSTLNLSDEVVNIGNHNYVKATATFTEKTVIFKEDETVAEGQTVIVTAYAKEPENQAGMSASQLTGTASSYARKYALNGLFLIDDTKDADTDEYAAKAPHNASQEQTGASTEDTIEYHDEERFKKAMAEDLGY